MWGVEPKAVLSVWIRYLCSRWALPQRCLRSEAGSRLWVWLWGSTCSSSFCTTWAASSIWWPTWILTQTFPLSVPAPSLHDLNDMSLVWFICFTDFRRRSFSLTASNCRKKSSGLSSTPSGSACTSTIGLRFCARSREAWARFWPWADTGTRNWARHDSSDT